MESELRKLMGQANQAREDGKFLESLELTDQATLECQKQKDLVALAEVQTTRVLTFRLLFDQDEDKNWLILAKHAAMSAVEIAETSGNPEALALPYSHLARAYMELNQYPEAVKYFQLALTEIVAHPPAVHNRPGVVADFKIHLAIAQYLAGDKTALDQAEKAIKELETSGEDKVSDYNYHVWLSGAHMRVAEMLKDDDSAKAKEHLQKAKEIIDSDSRLSLRLAQWQKLAKTIISS